MFRSRYLKDAAILAALTVVYFLGGKLGLRLASIHASATAVWPCTGIALAAFLILGYRVWPAILAGAFLVNLTTAGSVTTSMGIAVGNTLEGVVGCYLVSRFAGGQKAFERVQNVFRFTLFAGIISSAVSATVGVTTLAMAGFAAWPKYLAIWGTWWLGDGVGAVVVAPLLILWWQNPRLVWTRRQVVELAFLFSGLFLTGQIVFGGLFYAPLKNYPFEYLCIPFLIWAAFRFGRRKAATATCLLAVIATWGTLRGFGPFARESQNTSLLLVGTFMGIVAVMSMALSAEITERRLAEEHVRELVVTDALTGLANYRGLVDALAVEIRRYGRTKKTFAAIMLDLDGLKKINDVHGHLVGSRAICRLAEVLRIHSREIDTAARYGGDEFVLVLPETNLNEGQQVAQRISERLRNDGEEPPLSVSTGAAIYPQDGSTVEELLGAADRALYKQKHTRNKELRTPKNF
jgi:diguanylate cyclase (GGDEF)-like protein